MRCAIVEKCPGKGPHVNSRGKMWLIGYVDLKKEGSRKMTALEFAPLPSNCIAHPTKIICAAKVMAPAKRCKALVKLIVIVRVPSFVAKKTATGQRKLTAVRKMIFQVKEPMIYLQLSFT